MEKSKLDLISRICCDERKFLLTKPSPLTMYNPSPFPKGWCGVSARRIQETLRRSGIDAEYCEGDAYPDKTDRMNHAWLEYDGYIIDITADQFNDQGYSNTPIMITPDDSFHKIFKRK